MSAVRRFLSRTVLAAVALTMTLSMVGPGWAQMPLTDLTIPIPTGAGPTVLLNVNKTNRPPDQQQPYAKPFDAFGLLPPAVSGVCAQVTPTYIAVIDGQQIVRVFTYKQGYTPPSDVVAGRSVRLTYTRLSNGLFQTSHVRATGSGQGRVTGVPIPADQTPANPPMPTSQGVPNLNVKPVNGVIAP